MVIALYILIMCVVLPFFVWEMRNQGVKREVLFVGGLFTSMNMMYTYNLVGRSFRRFRPVAFGIVNLGAPTGNSFMPIIASTLIVK